MTERDEKHVKMMTEGTACPVTIRVANGKASSGEVRIQEWDKKARTSRAIKFWGLCWGLAIISVIIPLAHFVLVPGFFIAGPVGAWIISTQSRVILGGESICPNCNSFLPIAPAADSWPISDLCVHCQSRLVIEKA
jgi:hypothetical protein